MIRPLPRLLKIWEVWIDASSYQEIFLTLQWKLFTGELSKHCSGAVDIEERDKLKSHWKSVRRWIPQKSFAELISNILSFWRANCLSLT